METTTQSNVMTAIANRLEDSDLHLVRDGAASNTGQVYATDHLDPAGAVLTYRFDQGRVSFGRPNSADPVAVWSLTGGTAPFVCPTVADLVERVVALLGGE